MDRIITDVCDRLPHQLSPLLLVVCHGLCLCEGFAGPLRDVVSHLLFGRSLLRQHSTVPCSITLVRPSDLVTCPYHFGFRRFTVARRCSYGHNLNMLYNGFPHVHVSDSIVIGDAKDVPEECKL